MSKIAARKAKGGTEAAKGAPVTAKATKKATAAKGASKGKRAAKTQEAATSPREGSKTGQVVTMLQRKNGATLAEIRENPRVETTLPHNVTVSADCIFQWLERLEDGVYVAYSLSSSSSAIVETVRP